MDSNSPSELIKSLMDLNIRDAKSILEMCRKSGCMDSQEFMNWQDKLNSISVEYK